MTKKYAGQCACGAVKFEFDKDVKSSSDTAKNVAISFHHIADSGKGLDRVQLGSLDRPELICPKLEMFTKRRLTWNRPLDLPQFNGMPS